jgi:Methyltransferase FkbM domain
VTRDVNPSRASNVFNALPYLGSAGIPAHSLICPMCTSPTTKTSQNCIMQVSTINSRRKPWTTIVVALASSFALGYLAAFSSFSTSDRARSLRNTDVKDTPERVDAVAAGQKASGWKTIDVFYGTRDHLPKVSSVQEGKFRSAKSFAQVRQDEIVSKLFHEKPGGFFVDLAANDAVRLSNTYALERFFGWEGICIEPNSVYWPSLSYRRCHVVGAVAGGDREEVDFFFSRGKNGVLGGIVGEQYDNNETSRYEGWREPRLTVTLVEVFQRYKVPEIIDYFSLDVEGAEGIVLTQSVLSRYRFKVISLERPKDELQELLLLNGYTMLKKLSNWGETLWAHESVLQELDLSGFEKSPKSAR